MDESTGTKGVSVTTKNGVSMEGEGEMGKADNAEKRGAEKKEDSVGASKTKEPNEEMQDRMSKMEAQLCQMSAFIEASKDRGQHAEVRLKRDGDKRDQG